MSKYLFGLIALFFLVGAGPVLEIERRLTVEQLEAEITKDPNKRIKPFKLLSQALEKKNFAQALTVLKQVAKLEDFQDYYHFLNGKTEQLRMQAFLKKKQWATAISAGSQAGYHFSKVETSNPYTPLKKRTSILWGDTELGVAEAYVKLKNKKKAVMFLESGFQRLSQVGMLALVPKRSIIDYALLCEKKIASSVCTNWESKLASFVSKSDDGRLIEKIIALKPVPAVPSITSVPYRVDLDLQAFQKGYNQYLSKKFIDAYLTWRTLLEQYPRTSIKYRTKFWMGRAAQKSGHSIQAETLFREVIHDLPFSYYALMSSWLGGIDISRMMTVELPTAAADASVLSPADLIHIRRAEQLIASGTPDLARYELAEVVPSPNMPNDVLVYLTLANSLAGNHMAVSQIFSELSNRGFQELFSPFGQRLLFPLQFLEQAKSALKTRLGLFSIDPVLILSVMKQESAFNPEAISVSNAFGLMQLIRPTARDLEPRIEVSELFNPEKNIHLGTKYLQQLVSRYKGNIILALAAYNAGPANADRWLREAPVDLSPEEFIEIIGFRETHDYVQNILRNVYWYKRRLYRENTSSLPSLLEWSTNALVRLKNTSQRKHTKPERSVAAKKAKGL